MFSNWHSAHEAVNAEVGPVLQAAWARRWMLVVLRLGGFGAGVVGFCGMEMVWVGVESRGEKRDLLGSFLGLGR